MNRGEHNQYAPPFFVFLIKNFYSKFSYLEYCLFNPAQFQTAPPYALGTTWPQPCYLLCKNASEPRCCWGCVV